MNPYNPTFPTGYAYPPSCFKDYPRFITLLADAINDQAGAIQFYQKLMAAAQNAKHKAWIEHARNDEVKHLKIFTALYKQLTCSEPVVKAAETPFANFKAGVALAFEREMEATELYRDMYLSTVIPEVRDIFFETMTDEMEHAQKFTFIYAQL